MHTVSILSSSSRENIYPLTTRTQVDIPNIHFFTHGGRRTNRSSGVGAGVTISTTVVWVKLSTPDPNGELPYVGSNVVSIASVVGDGGGVGSTVSSGGLHTSI